MAMPHRIASAGERRTRRSPRRTIAPSSGWSIPYRIFMSVDFPAPFSPATAWIVPAGTLIETRWFAVWAPKRLVMPRSSTASGSGMGRREVSAVRDGDFAGDDPRPDRLDPRADRVGDQRSVVLVVDVVDALFTKAERHARAAGKFL